MHVVGLEHVPPVDGPVRRQDEMEGVGRGEPPAARQGDRDVRLGDQTPPPRLPRQHVEPEGLDQLVGAHLTVAGSHGPGP